MTDPGWTERVSAAYDARLEPPDGECNCEEPTVYCTCYQNAEDMEKELAARKVE